MIVIIDYGMGNVGSIVNMCRRLGIPATLSSRPDDIATADRLVLPGVGAFDEGIRKLREEGLDIIISDRVERDRIPILGICLGMQLMTESSDEGTASGFGWIKARTHSFLTGVPDPHEGIRLPHIGWNYVEPVREHPILNELGPDPRFYFVHSYKVVCGIRADVLCRTTYAGIEFHSGFARGNIVGLQFHPEKSHRYGMRVMSNFAIWRPEPSLSE